ncbi:fimbrial protein [Candidatus Pantoea floridensis]|uniref:Fimbrial protein n=1 Tax=Candidatus Pantoea floridensis TaxID=1938870 RepID=A0A286BTQ7_9GAMM|nr:fimbrial protein [Pantoea floridensis]PIF24074.1 fimbrial protein [Enterobacteriaceae bacterium JKS000233]SOD37527.1 Fimbrial protein [Pantoea floridensis]
MMNRRILLWVLILLALPLRIQAAVPMNMKGTLLALSCKINNEKPVDVSFGDAVGVNLVDGVNYRQKLALEIICTDPPGKLLHLKFLGNPTDFDPSAIMTNIDDLGIRLLKNDKPILINETLPLDNDRLLEFAAVPVKGVGSQLNGGDFHSKVTLQIVLE